MKEGPLKSKSTVAHQTKLTATPQPPSLRVTRSRSVVVGHPMGTESFLPTPFVSIESSIFSLALPKDVIQYGFNLNLVPCPYTDSLIVFSNPPPAITTFPSFPPSSLEASFQYH